MKKLFLSFGIVCATLLMASCSVSKKTVSVSSLDGEWNIIEVDGQHVTAAAGLHAPFIGFNVGDMRIFGNSGCNRMMGTFTADSLIPGKLQFGPIAGTRMACLDMTVEKSVLATLANVRFAKTVETEGRLALCDESGKQIVLLEKKAPEEAAPVTIASLAGEWAISTVAGEELGASQKEPFIGFNLDENRVFGSAGCNSINGAIKQDEEETDAKALTLGPIAATMMMCPDMEVERKVLKALNAVKSFDILSDGKAALYDADKNELMVLMKR